MIGAAADKSDRRLACSTSKLVTTVNLVISFPAVLAWQVTAAAAGDDGAAFGCAYLPWMPCTRGPVIMVFSVNSTLRGQSVFLTGGLGYEVS